jgi:iron complex transport system ATP-binding protein
VSQQIQTQTAIELDTVEFRYDAEPVIRGVDLLVPRGGFLGLLGPNGSGKTTLLQLISGAIKAAGGSIKVLGRSLADWDRRELACNLAVVPQKFELAFPFTVEEVVLLGRVPHRGPLSLDRAVDREAAREAMQQTGVYELRSRRMHELSGGEFKRVVVAKALAQQPNVLLLDEPAAHLDIRHQVTLYDLIRDIQRRTGVTVVSAMHDLNLAAAFCDSVALLKQGSFVRKGTIAEVMTYKNLKDAYEIDIYVGVNDITGHRLFTPMPPRNREKQ